MTYRVPAPPTGVHDDPAAQAAYLLEDGFAETPDGALAARLRERGGLRVKFGVDPTAPAVTWGWSVPLRRLRRFQELGHTAVLVIGDFTAQVGDPSGRSATRVRLTHDQVESYVQSCMTSLLEILSPERLEIRRNSEWLGTMDMAAVMALTSQATVAQLLERDDFSKRFAARQPISLIEFMYPLMQAHDSVEVRADVELGGTDQYFNLVLGRALQEKAGQAPQVCVTAPLLVGTDGQRKMSQSWGNYIGVAEPPAEVFGKVMSIPDEAMADYVRLATDMRPDAQQALLGELTGVQLKRRLAREMVAMFHGPDGGIDAEAAFDRVFVRRDVPEDVEETSTTERYLPKILVDLGWATSLSAARRDIKGGGVRVEGTPVTDEHTNLDPGTHLVQRGRRKFHRVTVE